MKTLDRYRATGFTSTFLYRELFVTKSCVQDELTPFRGGESEALKRLGDAMSNKVCYCALQGGLS